jgi:hypothetical protein
MIITHPSIKAALTAAGGPGEYFMRAKDSRNKLRVPPPENLFGSPPQIDRLARVSRSNHPHAHVIISYRGEQQPPAAILKNAILDMYVNLLLGGLKRDKVYCLAVRHGDHDHLAIYRHLIHPRWPRFQPYYHPSDKYLRSAFQWLVNLRHGFLAPEDPNNAQLVSVATRYFSQEAAEFVRTLRVDIAEQIALGMIQDRPSFITFLEEEKACHVKLERPSAIQDDDDELSKKRRVWLRITTPAGLVVSVKGPICADDFQLVTYNARLAEQRQKYESFTQKPRELWNWFITAIEMRRARNKKQFPQFFAEDAGECCGFAALNPSNWHGQPHQDGLEIS